MKTPEERFAALESLGYELIDAEIWDGWLLLEEASAEQIIRELLIPRNLRNQRRRLSGYCEKLKKVSFQPTSLSFDNQLEEETGLLHFSCSVDACCETLIMSVYSCFCSVSTMLAKTTCLILRHLRYSYLLFCTLSKRSFVTLAEPQSSSLLD